MAGVDSDCSGSHLAFRAKRLGLVPDHVTVAGRSDRGLTPTRAVFAVHLGIVAYPQAVEPYEALMTQ